MAETIPQLFGVVPTGSPCLTTPTSAPSPTSYIYILPTTPSHPFNHLTIFLLPGITLPPNTAAAVYLALPQSNPGAAPEFKFLGGIGEGKESAVFKISGYLGGGGGGGMGGGGEIDMDADTPSQLSQPSSITLGISLEPSSSISAQMALLQSTQSSSNSQALVLASKGIEKGKGRDITDTDTVVVLAQKIIKNAFNFLASFSGNVQVGADGRAVEVVPLKAFEDWWRKFEGRVRSDPGFLERD